MLFLRPIHIAVQIGTKRYRHIQQRQSIHSKKIGIHYTWTIYTYTYDTYRITLKHNNAFHMGDQLVAVSQQTIAPAYIFIFAILNFCTHSNEPIELTLQLRTASLDLQCSFSPINFVARYKEFFFCFVLPHSSFFFLFYSSVIKFLMYSLGVYTEQLCWSA